MKAKREAIRTYIDAWEEREEGSGWKFNKGSQNWIVKNIFDRKAIPKSVFEKAVGYVSSIQGSQRLRCLQQAQAHLHDNSRSLDEQVQRLEKKLKEQIEGSEEQKLLQAKIKALRAVHKRAKRIRSELSANTNDSPDRIRVHDDTDTDK